MHPILKYILAYEVYNYKYVDFEVDISCQTPTPGADIFIFDDQILIYEGRWLEALVYYVYSEGWITDMNQLLKTDAEVFNLAKELKKTSKVALVRDHVYYMEYTYPRYQ